MAPAGSTRGSGAGCWTSEPTPSSPTSAMPYRSSITCSADDKTSASVTTVTPRPASSRFCRSAPAEPHARRGDPDRLRRGAPPCSDSVGSKVDKPPVSIKRARDRGAAVILIYGAHLLRNGARELLERMMAGRLADSPGHQRRRLDPRLGIRLAGRLHRIGRGERRHRHVRHLGRDGDATFIWRSWPARSTAWAMADRWAGSSTRTARRCPIPMSLAARDRRRATASAHRRPRRLAADDARAGWPSGRIDVRPPLEARLDPRPGIPARRADDRPSGDRLRHHHQSSGVQRRGHRPGGGVGFQALRRLARATSTGASCSRSARPSWGPRSSRRP